MTSASGVNAGGTGRVPGVGGALRLLAADIKLAHSVFALPFALLGAFLAGPARADDTKAWWRFAGQLGLVVLCMVGARTWAMLINRLADRRIDAQNARTSGRVLASGRVGPVQAWALAALAAACFGAGAWGFWWAYGNPWPAYLAAPVLAWLALYSATKRFTALCHVVLGLSLAMSPLAAALAVRPGALLATPSLWWISGFVALWVAGFDVVYALQDEAFDRSSGLHSIPAALGTNGAVWVARAWHAVACLALLAAWSSHTALGRYFGIGVGATVLLLAIEHVMLAISVRAAAGAGARPGLHAVFFTLNGVLGCIIGTGGIVDLLGRVGGPPA